MIPSHDPREGCLVVTACECMGDEYEHSFKEEDSESYSVDLRLKEVKDD